MRHPFDENTGDKDILRSPFAIAVTKSDQI